jgi:hypothetical protein
VPGTRELGLGRLEHALARAVAARPHRTRLHDAVRSGALPALSGRELLDEAVARHVLSPEQLALIGEAEAGHDDAIQVDAYSPAAFARHHEPAVELPVELPVERSPRVSPASELPH